MIGFSSFHSRNKKYSVLALYVLHSLRQKPKSGYEILAEIKAKSGGKWVLSKGTLYPILDHLEKHGLIEICKTGMRSKHIFRPTKVGKETLSYIVKQRKEWMENFMRFRSLFADIMEKETTGVSRLGFEIQSLALTLSDGMKKDEVVRLLEKCLSDLKKIKAQDGDIRRPE
jgi:DNA-binding PadR family transcriptional regulator